METPNTPEGKLTEKIMAKVRAKFPTMPTSQYNGIYTAVLETLQQDNPVNVSPKFFHGKFYK